jgi:hypothetical protein
LRTPDPPSLFGIARDFLVNVCGILYQAFKGRFLNFTRGQFRYRQLLQRIRENLLA